MAVGTPVDIGHNAAAGATQVTVTLTGAISAGDFVGIGLGSSLATSNVSTIVDSGATNVYIPYVNVSGASSYFFACESAVGLASGQTITASFNGATGSHAVSVFRCTGLQVSDVFGGTATGSSGTNTTFTNISIKGAVPAGLVMQVVETATANLNTFSAGTGYTLLSAQTSSLGLRLCYQIQTVALSDPFTPSWVTNSAYSSRGYFLKGLTQTYQEHDLTMLGMG